jgi:hypothetical protein
MIQCAVIDAMGIYGNFFHYALIIALVGSAFMIFCYLWKKNRLDMDEEPKFQMMQEEEVKQGDHIHATRGKR